ncbi:MAG: polysaccharide deacetylase family protein [Candidatus Marinimicrobia bacterium]|nr:polysaccharide deacetylase family protein [Candidatus Neomarinimicrobiota bacterium]MCF7840518.1 polysaccharide deacetylase family protein [Candidatus Neomarinimicrobiota bacterium]MCF7902236.1 polysaccharide deacetylase family protein [Candidatus Neomarinimicrobiota bacterium]
MNSKIFSFLTATLILLIAACSERTTTLHRVYDHGGIIRTDTTQKIITLVFTGGDYADGGRAILETLNSYGIKGAFFFTGDFYRNPDYSKLIRDLKQDEHYLGAHSDRHLLYCDWSKRGSTLVTQTEFREDVESNYAEMARFGIRKQDAPWFLPAFEWYNDTISAWTNELGLTLVNFSPGTYSNADYTTPDMGKRYLDSETIFQRILDYEAQHGLNGFLLLTHIGTDPRRTDKFYHQLDKLIVELHNRGYRFVSLPEALGNVHH